MSQPTRRLGVLGPDEPTAAVRAAATEAGAHLVAPDEADAVVAVGDVALREAVVAAGRGGDAPDDPQSLAGGEVPILPVGSGRHAVDPECAGDAVERLVGGDRSADGLERVRHPLLAVGGRGDGSPRTAAFDVAFVTAEPARISEYGIAFSDGEAASFRADGAVVATPLGSGGYAGAAGGPRVSPGGGLSVVPIAPFTTRTDTWVATDGVGVTVEREAHPVALVVDGTRRGTVEPHREVDVSVAGRVDLLAPVDG